LSRGSMLQVRYMKLLRWFLPVTRLPPSSDSAGSFVRPPSRGYS
jgi:hypothetical protein